MFQMTCNAKADWLATAAARVGYTWGRALFYVKGGGAWTDEQFSATCNTASASPASIVFACRNPADALSNGFTAGTNRTGWVLGFGTEFAFTRNWSAKAETDYISFGDTYVTASDGSPPQGWYARLGRKDRRQLSVLNRELKTAHKQKPRAVAPGF
jgi:opacity protein-like surface antigen